MEKNFNNGMAFILSRISDIFFATVDLYSHDVSKADDFLEISSALLDVVREILNHNPEISDLGYIKFQSDDTARGWVPGGIEYKELEDTYNTLVQSSKLEKSPNDNIKILFEDDEKTAIAINREFNKQLQEDNSFWLPLLSQLETTRLNCSEDIFFINLNSVIEKFQSRYHLSREKTIYLLNHLAQEYL